MLRRKPIGVIVTLGVTFTLQFEPAATPGAALDRLQQETDLDRPTTSLFMRGLFSLWAGLFEFPPSASTTPMSLLGNFRTSDVTFG